MVLTESPDDRCQQFFIDASALLKDLSNLENEICEIQFIHDS